MRNNLYSKVFWTFPPSELILNNSLRTKRSKLCTYNSHIPGSIVFLCDIYSGQWEVKCGREEGSMIMFLLSMLEGVMFGFFHFAWIEKRLTLKKFYHWECLQGCSQRIFPCGIVTGNKRLLLVWKTLFNGLDWMKMKEEKTSQYMQSPSSLSYVCSAAMACRCHIVTSSYFPCGLISTSLRDVWAF